MPLKWKTGTGRSARIVAGMLVALTFVSYANGDDLDVSFPYQAIVLKDSASVHSGPGSVHYATDKLDQGATVEVHRHDPGGWCAVRPVKGSFSLVPSATINVIDDQVGEVIEAGTQAWVGTRLGAVEKPLWQVKLREGEHVEILGEVSWPHPEGHSTIWYQIAPPAGEFRWMRISDLQLPPSAEGTTVRANDKSQDKNTIASRSNVRSLVDVPQPSSGPVQQTQPIAAALAVPGISVAQANVAQTGTQQSGAQLSQPQEPSKIQLVSAAQPNNMNLGWRQSTRPIPNTETGFDRLPVVGAQAPVASQPDRVASRLPATGDNPVPTRPELTRTLINSRPPADRYASLAGSASSNRFNGVAPSTDSVQNLELRLTNEMVKDPTRWQIDSILDSAMRVRDSAASANEQLQATRLVDKCRNCLQVQAGFAHDQPAAGSGRKSPANSNVIGSGLQANDQDVSFGTTYDAFGWLNELVRKQGQLESEYVLQNGDGKITHHVTASPGLNLRRYLKSKVGIIGQRGYNHALKLDHVVADRIIVLDQSR